MNRSTFRRKIFSLCALVFPAPQKSEGIRRRSTARQNADTIAAGVEWSSIDCFRVGTLFVLVAMGRVDIVLFETCVLNMDALKLCAGSAISGFVA
jgi:hypothetical protein